MRTRRTHPCARRECWAPRHGCDHNHRLRCIARESEPAARARMRRAPPCAPDARRDGVGSAACTRGQGGPGSGSLKDDAAITVGMRDRFKDYSRLDKDFSSLLNFNIFDCGTAATSSPPGSGCCRPSSATHPSPALCSHRSAVPAALAAFLQSHSARWRSKRRRRRHRAPTSCTW